jgi:hypothetical protein
MPMPFKIFQFIGSTLQKQCECILHTRDCALASEGLDKNWSN